jgi:hypothetical protein
VDTSGSGLPNIILYIVVLTLFVQVAIRLLREAGPPATPGAPGHHRPFPVFALAATVVIGVPSLLQYVWPILTTTLDRNPDLTLQHGQWWRVLTALLAQDGGLAGAIFNLVVVAGVTLVGEWVWGSWLALLLFLIPSLGLNLLAIVLWHAPGGGSSFASDGLLTSVCALALLTLRDPIARVCAAIAILIGIALIVFLNDAHGVAILVGAALGILFALGKYPRPRLPNSPTE